MTAPVGSNAFTTTESENSEDRTKRIFDRILSEPKYSAFTVKESYCMNEVYATDLASNKSGKPSETKPDLGLLMLNGKPVGVGDNKYQDTDRNACERVNLYTVDALTMGFPAKNVFIHFDGPGFDRLPCGNYKSAPGKQIVRSMKHNTCIIQATNEQLDTEIRMYLDRILKENT